MKEESKNIRGQELVTYISTITKLLQRNAESGDPSSAAGNEEGGNPTNTSYERLDGLVPVILSIPDYSSNFYLPQDIIENVQSSSIITMNEKSKYFMSSFIHNFKRLQKKEDLNFTTENLTYYSMEDFCVKNLNGNDMQVLFDSNIWIY